MHTHTKQMEFPESRYSIPKVKDPLKENLRSDRACVDRHAGSATDPRLQEL